MVLGPLQEQLLQAKILFRQAVWVHTAEIFAFSFL